MEKGATIGMVGLALSDLLFCLVTLGDTFLLEESMYYTERDMSYFFRIYGNYFQNTLIKLSTWFTVIMAIGRFAAVCYPMRARQYMRPCHTVVAILFVTCLWSVIKLPLLWTWNVRVLNCSQDLYILDMGSFATNQTLKKTCTIVWASFGFFIPVFILAYCNVRLIHSLHISKRMRQAQNAVGRMRSQDRHQRINITLICIVVMFFLCLFPSEVLHFSLDISSIEIPASAILVCNLLQAINFSSNFILYCAVNSYFRKAVMRLIPCHWNKDTEHFTFSLTGWKLHRKRDAQFTSGITESTHVSLKCKHSCSSQV